jgi:hypothetical protein
MVSLTEKSSTENQTNGSKIGMTYGSFESTIYCFNVITCFQKYIQIICFIKSFASFELIAAKKFFNKSHAKQSIILFNSMKFNEISIFFV